MGSKVTVNMGHPVISGYQLSHNDVKIAGTSASGWAATSVFSVSPGPDSLVKRVHNQSDATYEARYPTDYTVSPSSIGSLGFLSSSTVVQSTGLNVSVTGFVSPVLQVAYQATGLNVAVNGTVNPVANPSGITPIMKIGNDQAPVREINLQLLTTGTNHYSFDQTKFVTPVNAAGNKASMTYFNGNSVVTV